MIVGSAEMTMLKVLVAFPALLVALTVKLKVPVADGQPKISPVSVFKLKPVGSLPLLIAQVIGAVPVAVRV